jgi:alpha-aminoadipic semialdehyde synthase
MPMLKKLMSLGCNLIDYEKVVDDEGKRILFFGRYAGIAGMHDTLWALGKRLDSEKTSNPFSKLKQTYEYPTLKELKQAVSEVGKRISQEGLPDSLVPFVCGFTGYGHVSQGAQEIFNLLPHKTIPPEKIPDLFENSEPSGRTLYKAVFEERHLVVPRSEGNAFDLQDYYDHPEKYAARFHHYLPYLTLVINGIYWTPRYPRIISIDHLKALFQNDTPRLKVIGDITCDVDGSVACTVRATQPDNPVFVYDPATQTDTDGWTGPGVVVLAVDNLPCELPRASSLYFSNALIDFVPGIVRADVSVPFAECTFPAAVKAATLLYRGNLTPDYLYLREHL